MNTINGKTVDLNTAEGLMRLEFHNGAKFARERLDKWQVGFARNPGQALAWSSDAFRDAGTLEVAIHITKILDNATPAVALEEIRNEVMRRSRGITSRSTSALSNEMDACLLAAYASALESIEGIVRCAAKLAAKAVSA